MGVHFPVAEMHETSWIAVRTPSGNLVTKSCTIDPIVRVWYTYDRGRALGGTYGCPEWVLTVECGADCPLPYRTPGISPITRFQLIATPFSPEGGG